MDRYSTDKKQIKHYTGMMALSLILILPSAAFIKYSVLDNYKLVAFGVSILGVFIGLHYKHKIAAHLCSNCNKEFLGYTWSSLTLDIKNLSCQFCGIDEND